MSFKISFGTLSGESNKARPRGVESPFRVGIMGDFTGRASRQVNEPIDQRKTWKIDCDNFDKVLARLEPKLKLQQADLDQPLELVFRSLEDFHPDKVVLQVHTLSGLVQQRARLADPSTAQAAVKDLEQLVHPGPITHAPTPANSGSESNEETMARLLGGTPMTTKTTPSATAEGSVQRLIEKIVAPSLKPGTSPEQLALLSMLDLELAQRLRAILHHPDFQALEAAWRSVDFLIRRFGAEENLKFSLLDVSRGELEADLLLREDLESTGIFKHLHRQADDETWSMCLGLYSFGASDDDFKLLGRLAKIFSHGGIPMICEAKPSLLGCASLERYPRPEEWQPENSPTLLEGWRALRALPQASNLGLALPRFLLRQPYGKASDPIESFPFEELSGDDVHEWYLWGNPAILFGAVLAEAFQSDGWSMQLEGYGEVDDLSVHQFEQDGESMVKPCAEVWLSDRAGEAILERGLMPVLSIKGRDAVRLPRLQSISSHGFSRLWQAEPD